MPEIRFQIQWPDGIQEDCYSPSLVVQKYFEPNREYSLEDFVTRSQTALQIGSDRVMEKYGMPCSLAISQIQRIKTAAARYQDLSDPKVQFIRFME
jgi:uncharacterized repeat protein (TIGR04042 family)